jgi:hypothetical protein
LLCWFGKTDDWRLLLNGNIGSFTACRSKSAKQGRQSIGAIRENMGSIDSSQVTCRQAQIARAKIEPLKKVARTLRIHRVLLLNWFRAKGAISAGTIEGLSNKVKLTTRKSYGFRTYEAIEIALFHNLGRLPEPQFTHRFCEEAFF